MTYARRLLFGLTLLAFPIGLARLAAAQTPAPAVGKPETATAASVSAATGATVSEMVVLAPPKPKSVSELDVTATIKCVAPKIDRHGHPPRVLSSYPKNGDVVRPGLLIMRVTFDQPMSCAGYFAAEGASPNPCDESGARQRFLMSFDRRTIRTPCLVLPGTQYRLSMNQVPDGRLPDLPPPLFIGMNGWKMDGYHLNFTTSAQPLIATVREALGEDPATKLTPGGD